MDDTVGATGRGGVARRRPIGMQHKHGLLKRHPIGVRYEPGFAGRYPIGMLGVAGKHPIGMAGVARCKHGVCAQIGVGAKASTVKFSQANLSQLPHRSYEHLKRLYSPKNSAW